MALALLSCSLAFAASADISESYSAEARYDFGTALRIMQELVVAEPNEPFYQVRLAWLQYLSGQYRDAIASYQKSITLLDNLDAHIGIINSQLALGNYTEAIRLTDIQLAVHKQNPTLYTKAAYAAYMMKDYAKAAAYYKSAIAIYPWDMESRGYLVNNLYLAGNIKEAKDQYTLLKKYYPKSAIVEQYKDILK
jgi:tetratricopeptide (TPR) repeat protein